MINLLGNNDKKQLHAARRNTIWLRYTLIIIVSLIAINLVLGATALLIIGQKQAFEQRIGLNENKRDKQYLSDKANAETFRKNLTAAKFILSGETAYSKVILNIAHTIPTDCIMQNLTLTTQSFSVTPQSLGFNCRHQEDAIRLKTAMEQNTDLFSDVHIVSTTDAAASGSGGQNRYPISITMLAVIKKPISSSGEAPL